MVVLACGSGAETSAPASASPSGDEFAGAVAQEIVREAYEVVRQFPHDPAAFTQGLAFHQGYLIEGTGRRGQSSLRKVEIETGRVVKQTDISPTMFGEGIAIHDGRVYQLTWTSGIGFIYDLDTFEAVQQFRQVTQGWGLTSDGESLIQSDGTRNLYFLDPATMQASRSVEVHDANGFIDQINELEYIDGEIYANIWQRDRIVRISPETGTVLSWVDLTGLLPQDARHGREDVLNGIAYDEETGRLFVTGKFWPKLFEIEIVPPESN